MSLLDREALQVYMSVSRQRGNAMPAPAQYQRGMRLF